MRQQPRPRQILTAGVPLHGHMQPHRAPARGQESIHTLFYKSIFFNIPHFSLLGQEDKTKAQPSHCLKAKPPFSPQHPPTPLRAPAQRWGLQLLGKQERTRRCLTGSWHVAAIGTESSLSARTLILISRSTATVPPCSSPEHSQRLLPLAALQPHSSRDSSCICLGRGHPAASGIPHFFWAEDAPGFRQRGLLQTLPSERADLSVFPAQGRKSLFQLKYRGFKN